MDRCIAFVEAHKKNTLQGIVEETVNQCTSKIPNALCSREQYFVSLEFKQDSKLAPFKAFVL